MLTYKSLSKKINMRLFIIRNFFDILVKLGVEACFCKGGFREILEACPVECVFEVFEREGTGGY